VFYGHDTQLFVEHVLQLVVACSGALLCEDLNLEGEEYQALNASEDMRDRETRAIKHTEKVWWSKFSSPQVLNEFLLTSSDMMEEAHGHEFLLQKSLLSISLSSIGWGSNVHQCILTSGFYLALSLQ
jgi:hypothetical protein